MAIKTDGYHRVAARTSLLVSAECPHEVGLALKLTTGRIRSSLELPTEPKI